MYKHYFIGSLLLTAPFATSDANAEPPKLCFEGTAKMNLKFAKDNPQYGLIRPSTIDGAKYSERSYHCSGKTTKGYYCSFYVLLDNPATNTPSFIPDGCVKE